MGKHLEQALPSMYTLQCLTGKVDNNNHETGGTIVVFTEISILVFREMQKLFLKFCAPHKEQDRTCCLVRYYLELM